MMIQKELNVLDEDATIGDGVESMNRNNVSYCIDLDAIFSLLRCENQLNGYRIKEITQAIIKYLDYTIPTLNDKDFLFNHYTSAHKLTGCLGAIAEIYKFRPLLFDSSIKFNQSLDITPWI